MIGLLASGRLRCRFTHRRIRWGRNIRYDWRSSRRVITIILGDQKLACAAGDTDRQSENGRDKAHRIFNPDEAAAWDWVASAAYTRTASTP
jgi:hypothetical protein